MTAEMEHKRELCLAELLAGTAIIAKKSTSIQSRAMAMTMLWAVDYICANNTPPTEGLQRQKALEFKNSIMAGTA